MNGPTDSREIAASPVTLNIDTERNPVGLKINVATNTIRHEAYDWAKGDPQFMQALRYAMTQTSFIMAANGLSAERMHVLWSTIADAIEREAS